MSLQKAYEWLQKTWWGIIVAYGVVSIVTFAVIQAFFLEPASVPENIPRLPALIHSRLFIHIILTLFISSYITLILELYLRRATWNKWIQNETDENYSSEFYRLTKGLRRIVHLLPSELTIRNWKITHSIEKDGSDVYREELTLIPNGEPVYFHFKRFLLPKNSVNGYPKISAENLLDNTPLVTFELERNERYVYYVILLDPPTTITTPKRIAITCERNGIWNNLIEQGEDEGIFTANHQADSITMEFIAPHGRKWKGFHPAPLIGEIRIASESISRVIWTLENVSPKKYVYQVFTDKSR